MKTIAIILVSLMTALTSFVPAQAFPAPALTTAAGSTDVETVQYRQKRKIILRHQQRSNNRYDRYDRQDRYSNNRRYDRRHRNNNGAIIGGLAAGAIIGGAIASQNRNGSSCAARYRSYRASDNTYQPNSGPRRVCR